MARQLQQNILQTLEWGTYQFEGCAGFNPWDIFPWP